MADKPNGKKPQKTDKKNAPKPQRRMSLREELEGVQKKLHAAKADQAKLDSELKAKVIESERNVQRLTKNTFRMDPELKKERDGKIQAELDDFAEKKKLLVKERDQAIEVVKQTYRMQMHELEDGHTARREEISKYIKDRNLKRMEKAYEDLENATEAHHVLLQEQNIRNGQAMDLVDALRKKEAELTEKIRVRIDMGRKKQEENAGQQVQAE